MPKQQQATGDNGIKVGEKWGIFIAQNNNLHSLQGPTCVMELLTGIAHRTAHSSWNCSQLSDSSETRQQFKPRRLFLHPAYNKATDTHDAMIVGALSLFYCRCGSFAHQLIRYYRSGRNHRWHFVRHMGSGLAMW